MRATGYVQVLTLLLALGGGLAAKAAEPDAPGRSPFTDKACTQMSDAAAAFEKNIQMLQGSLAQALTQTRIEVTRELAPLMHRFADQLRDLARELESPRAARDS